jgi:hypothetical protein
MMNPLRMELQEYLLKDDTYWMFENKLISKQHRSLSMDKRVVLMDD